MIEWLERYLTQTHITLFMVTHDRYFLERICTDIFSLERGKLIQYPGNYSYFLEKKAEREENEQIALHKLKQLLRKELAWIRRAPSGRQTKSDFRAKRYEDIQDSYTGKRKDAESKSQRLVLEVKERTLGSKIVVCKHVQKSFGDKVILKDFTYEFRYRDRVGIIGKNGVGKTTFLQLLLGEALPDGGTIVLGETIVVGYYQQKQMQFPEEKKLIDVVPFPTLLEKFLFPPAQQHQRISTLSGGEKKRLQLLTILMHNPNFLILDEPTNDLDVLTLGVLEDFLLQYKGCLIVVSHDRFFMDRIVEHLFVFTGNGAIDDFRGTYSEYAATNSSPTLAVASQRKVISLVEEEEDDKKSSLHKKLSYNEKRELDALAQDIETLESRKDEVNRLFNQKDLSYDEITFLSEELGDILKQLEQKEYRRLELSERV
ncbi:MAG: ABC-F family ATP-binding cassette domain-containing protein [bacterium]